MIHVNILPVDIIIILVNVHVNDPTIHNSRVSDTHTYTLYNDIVLCSTPHNVCTCVKVRTKY